MGIAHHDKEGRIITAEFSDFYLVNVYTPNLKESLNAWNIEWNGKMIFARFEKLRI